MTAGVRDTGVAPAGHVTAAAVWGNDARRAAAWALRAIADAGGGSGGGGGGLAQPEA